MKINTHEIDLLKKTKIYTLKIKTYTVTLWKCSGESIAIRSFYQIDDEYNDQSI